MMGRGRRGEGKEGEGNEGRRQGEEGTR